MHQEKDENYPRSLLSGELVTVYFCWFERRRVFVAAFLKLDLKQSDEDFDDEEELRLAFKRTEKRLRNDS
ncbi:hypothetical protein [Candidatus Halobonum tyrrellensis]|uniref:hypothetical protein n=1 Tax=Candidatus Halobonum tyrrellensis TaxID=1431545 RepID=UPI00126799BF|nr:hypothetical protein [Candidatus Halobonum tyrrellensis]